MDWVSSRDPGCDVVVAVWPGEREPEFQGKKLSWWLARRNRESEDATNAIVAIGTNALPFLLKWVEYEIPEWREKAANNTAKWPRWRISFWVAKHLHSSREGLAQRAEFGFAVLGEVAVPTIPELSRYVRDPKVRSPLFAAQSLAHIGPGAVAPLVAALEMKDQTERRRWEILVAMAELENRGPEIHKTIPVLVSCLTDTNEFIGSLAAGAMGSFLIEPEKCIPALTKAAGSANPRVRREAIRGLEQFGPRATPAVNAIAAALHDSDRGVRYCATNALKKIAPNVLTNGVGEVHE